MATIKNLKDLYIDGVKDMHSACKQSIPVTEEMVRAAQSEDLKKALEASIKGTREGMASMEKIARAHGADPAGEHCKGMEGLAAEARKHALEAEFADEDTQDAAIIGQYQRLAHYAITGYGTLKAWAKRLGFNDDAKILDQCTAATYEGDEDMTRIAVRGGINKAAM
jgi:ferritin-like metal-binding protein YciE